MQNIHLWESDLFMVNIICKFIYSIAILLEVIIYLWKEEIISEILLVKSRKLRMWNESFSTFILI